MRSKRRFHTRGNLICCCTNSYFAVECKVRHPTAAGPLSFSWSSSYHCCSQWRNHWSNELRKGGNPEEPTVAYCGQITLQSCWALLLSGYTENDSALRRREVWLVSHSQPLFLRTAWSTGKRGWLRETKVWPHETRRTAAKRVVCNLNMQSIPCCKD